MYGGWVGGELLWGEHTSSEFNHLRSRVAQGQGACLPSSLNALMICLSSMMIMQLFGTCGFEGMP